VPVACSGTTSLPEVANGAALEFDPLSVGDITAAMTTLARDDALRARCIAAGQRRALELTWDEAARRTVAVYHEVLNTESCASSIFTRPTIPTPGAASSR
jgi:alpha-1,3-rhamnosyl/mannosyltransferase